jgi:hypothetical protein
VRFGERESFAANSGAEPLRPPELLKPKNKHEEDIMNAKILSAHDLRSGLVVYLTSEGGWSRHLVRAAPATNEQTQARLLQISERATGSNHVIDPAFIDVDWRETGPVPARLRERIRATGVPPVPFELARAAAE